MNPELRGDPPNDSPPPITPDSKTIAGNRRLDPQLAKFFEKTLKTESIDSQNRTSEALEKMLKEFDIKLKMAIQGIFTYLQRRRRRKTSDEPLNPPLEALELLYRLGFKIAVATALGSLDRELSALDLSHIDLIASGDGLIDAWIKQKSGMDPTAVERLKVSLLNYTASNSQATIMSYLGTWYCRNLDPRRLKDAKPLIQEACHRFPPRAAEMFSILVARDRTGDFVFDWLLSDSENSNRLARLAQIDTRLLEGIQKSTPTWMNHGQANLLIDLCTGIHSDFEAKAGPKRAAASAQLLAFAASLIPLAEENRVAAEILQRLQAISLGVWKESAESPDRRHTWAFIQAGNIQLGAASEVPVSPESASILGLALRKARKGKNAITELESALVNIGLERFGGIGSKASYDPLLHDDTDGGLIPGDAVQLSASGFRYQGKIIVKAPVTEIELP